MLTGCQRQLRVEYKAGQCKQTIREERKCRGGEDGKRKERIKNRVERKGEESKEDCRR